MEHPIHTKFQVYDYMLTINDYKKWSRLNHRGGSTDYYFLTCLSCICFLYLFPNMEKRYTNFAHKKYEKYSGQVWTYIYIYLIRRQKQNDLVIRLSLRLSTEFLYTKSHERITINKFRLFLFGGFTIFYMYMYSRSESRIQFLTRSQFLCILLI